jgi:ArsR family transcriptional regulator, arsenate/arsenite/antimonite-responsive transcriptional repressor
LIFDGKAKMLKFTNVSLILSNPNFSLPLFGNKRTIMSLNNSITDEQKKIARYAKAMGHPIRMYVLELLSKQSCCYSGDLSEVLPIVKSTLSQHLKELKDAGLIQGEIEAPKVKYCLNKENWKEAQDLFKKFLNI